MAQVAVDATRPWLGRPVPPSCTASVPLLGAEGIAALRNRRAALSAEAGLAPRWIDHLLDRYGALIDELLPLVADDPELCRPVQGASGYLRAEIVYGATHEGALHLADLLERRTHASIEEADGGRAAARSVAALAAEALGWDDARREGELASFLARTHAERRAREAPDEGKPLACRDTRRETPEL
jgi:glycerol-3-phosphate dehydrogenase